MREIEKLAKSHKKWINVVCSFNVNKCFAEDIVQDAYIKIMKRIEEGADITYGEDDVNEFYMFMTLRNLSINFLNKKNSWSNLNISQNQESLDYQLSKIKAEFCDVEMEGAYNSLITRIFSEINSWDFYSRNIFIAYFTTSLSLTSLSKETGIGRSSLYNSIKLCRDIITKEFSEDVEDFYNKDYNKL